MSLDEYERFFHAACHTDEDAPEEYWRSVAGALHSRADELAGVRELRILGPDTDLRVVRRRAHVARRRRDAQHARRRGLHEPGRDRDGGGDPLHVPRRLHGPRGRGRPPALRGRPGRRRRGGARPVVPAELLDLDEGARTAGEIAFGLNYEIDRFTRNILLDEKIGGTMHLALGAGFPQAGGQNTSGLHWDSSATCAPTARSTPTASSSGRPACSSRSPPPWKSPRAAVPDPRVERLAEVAIGYSTAVQPGDLVLIDSTPLAAPLVRETVRAVLAAGGHPHARFSLDGALEALLEEGNDEQLGWLSPARTHEIEHANVRIVIESEVNTRSLTGADPARQALAHKARKPLSRPAVRAGHVRGAALARDALPDPGGRAGRRHVALRLRGLRLPRRLPRPGRSGGEWRAFGERLGRTADWLSHEERAADRRRGHRPHARRRRPHVDPERRPRELPRRRGLHGPGRDERRGHDPVQLPGAVPRTRRRGRRAALRRRRGRAMRTRARARRSSRRCWRSTRARAASASSRSG